MNGKTVSWEDLTPEQQEALINWLHRVAEAICTPLENLSTWLADALAPIAEELKKQEQEK